MILDSIENAHIYESISPRMKIALDYMRANDLSAMEPGKYEIDGSDVTVTIKKGYKTKPEEECRWENHEKYIDIQYLLEGRERIGYCPAKLLEPRTPYNEEKDNVYYQPSSEGSRPRLSAGMYMILFPEDGHMALIADGEATVNNKAVFKVLY